MRILMVHNRYQQRGGEDAVFEAESALLRTYGHDVHTLEFTNDSIDAQMSTMSKLKLAADTVWSRDGAKKVADTAEAFGAEVVHFHNTLPLVSPAAYAACQQRGISVVQTLHNFRLLCPGVNFFRDGKACEDCLGKPAPVPGIVHGCYRESRAQTAVVATMITAHRMRRTWQRDVDMFIALSEFSRSKFIKGGLPASKLVVKPNFTEAPAPSPAVERSGFFSVGRLSAEKGIPTLLSAWDRDSASMPLRIAGDGPFGDMVQDAASRRPAIQTLGRIDRDGVMREMRAATALVFTSECYENFPVSIVEAYACGLPVIAPDHGAMSELIQHGRNGLHFEVGNADDLHEKVQWAATHPEEMEQMSRRARATYDALYTPTRNHEFMMDIYDQAISRQSADIWEPVAAGVD